MAWRITYEVLETADGSNTRVHSPFKFTKNAQLHYMRAHIIAVGDPSYTAVSMKIYSDDGSGSPSALLATSTDSRSKAQLQTNEHAVAETYFTFDPLSLRKDDTYHAVLGISGYTGTTSSHLGLVRSWPDPIIESSSFDFNKVLLEPFKVYPIFSEL